MGTFSKAMALMRLVAKRILRRGPRPPRVLVTGNGGCVRLINDCKPVVINDLIRSRGYRKYLEIGVRHSMTIKAISCPLKHGVDPNHLCSHKMTSDEFFEKLPQDFTYDLIFVDGLHLESQVDRDIANSLKHLSEGGTVVVHDCSPKSEDSQRHIDDPKDIPGIWNGTVWRSFAKLRMSRDDLSMFVIDTDHGIGVLRPGHQELFKMPEGRELDYSLLDDYRKELLNSYKSVWACSYDDVEKMAKSQDSLFLSDCECCFVDDENGSPISFKCVTFKPNSPSAGEAERVLDGSEFEKLLSDANSDGLVPVAFRDDADLTACGGFCLCDEEFKKRLFAVRQF